MEGWMDKVIKFSAFAVLPKATVSVSPYYAGDRVSVSSPQSPYYAGDRVSVRSPQSPYYAGDRVTLGCDIVKYTDWVKYTWYNNGTAIPSETHQTITVTLPDKPGQHQYACRGHRLTSPQISQLSDALSITSLGE